MSKKIVPLLLVIAIMGMTMGVVGLLRSDNVGASTHSATRSLPAQVTPGGEVSVTIAVANYGRFGGVAETIPAGFTYVDGSSNVAVEVSGRNLEFTLYGETSVTYRVTAANTAGSHVFSGELIDDQGDRSPVGGVSSVTVEATQTSTDADATRSLPTQVAPGGEVSVTIAVANYGQFGGVAETIPAGFTYVDGSSNVAVEVSGRNLEFTLYGETSVTYRVTAANTAGSHVFSGELIDDQGDRSPVGGVSSVTVEATQTSTDADATRSLPTQVTPGGEVSVTIAVANYGQFGGVAETIPAGFTYVDGSSNVAVEVSGRNLEFTLYGETSVTYRVTAANTAGSHVFSGELIDDQGDRSPVGGVSPAIRVRQSPAPAKPPKPPVTAKPPHRCY